MAHVTRLDLNSVMFLVSSTHSYKREEFEKVPNVATIFSKNAELLKTQKKELLKKLVMMMIPGKIKIYYTDRFKNVCLPGNMEPVRGRGIVIFNTSTDGRGIEERTTIHVTDERDVSALCNFINKEKNLSKKSGDMNYQVPLYFEKEGIIEKHKKVKNNQNPMFKSFWGEIRRMDNDKLQLSLNRSGIAEKKGGRLYELNDYNVEYDEVRVDDGRIIRHGFKLKSRKHNFLKPIEGTFSVIGVEGESRSWLSRMAQPGGAILKERTIFYA